MNDVEYGNVNVVDIQYKISTRGRSGSGCNIKSMINLTVFFYGVLFHRLLTEADQCFCFITRSNCMKTLRSLMDGDK